jgi:hypothetical protein
MFFGFHRTWMMCRHSQRLGNLILATAGRSGTRNAPQDEASRSDTPSIHAIVYLRCMVLSIGDVCLPPGRPTRARRTSGSTTASPRVMRFAMLSPRGKA